MSIGSRLKRARKGANVSLRDLAERVDLSAMMISKYERDKSVPNSEMLLRFAKELGTKIDYFFRPESLSVELQAYRKHTSLGKKKIEAIKVRVQDWLERYLDVEDFFPQEKIQINLPSYKAETLDDVEDAAKALREVWDLGMDPIENLIQLLEDKGIKVGLVSGYDDFDACTFTYDDHFVIASKSEISGDRQRFNIAHELGHLVLDCQGEIDEEKAANRFAGAFLVPAEKAIFELGMYRKDLDLHELYLLKHKYGLSMQAWVYRAKDLNIISQNTASRLFKNFRANYLHREEPGDPYPSEKPLRMEKLIYRALAEDLITRSKAQALLGKSLKHRWEMGA